MKSPLIFFLLLFSIPAATQYYYKDLTAAEEINRQMRNYVENKIQKVSSTGYTSSGSATADYKETQEVNEFRRQLRITTINNLSINWLVYYFDSNWRIKTNIDSTTIYKSVSEYSYDDAGNITEIKNTMVDSAKDFTQIEIHTWQYKNNKPEKMWRAINKGDSLEVRFKTDETGNVIEEQNFKRGKGAEPTFYYYDDKNRLTDIVRYNVKARRLLPDFLFEYDEANRVIQKITTTSNYNLGYLTWRYLYNEKGLKTKEALFNKEKQLQGRIDYSYLTN